MSTQERIDALNAEMSACLNTAEDTSKTEAQRIEALLRIQAISQEITAAYATLNDEFIANVRRGVVPQERPLLRWDIHEL